MFIAHLALVSAVPTQNLFVPTTLMDDADIGTGQIIFSQTHAYKVAAGKIQVDFNNNWVNCMDVPASGQWSVQDVDETHVVIVNYKISDSADKTMLLDNNSKRMLYVHRYVKSATGCTLDVGDPVYGGPAEYFCSVNSENIVHVGAYGVEFPDVDANIKKVDIIVDGSNAYVYADEAGNSGKQLRLFMMLELLNPTFHGTCYAQYDDNIDKKVFLSTDAYQWRLYDSTNQRIQVIKWFGAFWDRSWRGFGLQALSKITTADDVGTQCSFSSSIGNVNSVSSSVQTDWIYGAESFFATDSQVLWGEDLGTTGSCEVTYKATQLANAIYFSGQHAVTYDQVNKIVKVYFVDGPFSNSNLNFQAYVTYDNVIYADISGSRNSFSLFVMQNNGALISAKVHKYAPIKAADPAAYWAQFYLPNQDDVQVVNGQYEITSSNPWLYNVVPNVASVGLTLTPSLDSGSNLKITITSGSFSYVFQVGQATPLTQIQEYTNLMALKAADITTTLVQGGAPTVEFKFSTKAQYELITKFFNKPYQVQFPTCQVTDCTPSDSGTKFICKLPQDYSSSEYNGNLTINIGSGDIKKNISLTLNKGVKPKYFYSVADCSAGKTCDVTIYGDNMGVFDTSVFSTANLPAAAQALLDTASDPFAGLSIPADVFDDFSFYDPTMMGTDPSMCDPMMGCGTGTGSGSDMGTGMGSGSGYSINPVTGRQINPFTGYDINPSTGNDINPTTGRDIDFMTGRDINPSTLHDINPITGNDINPLTGYDIDPITGQDIIPSGGNPDNTPSNVTVPMKMKWQKRSVPESRIQKRAVTFDWNSLPDPECHRPKRLVFTALNGTTYDAMKDKKEMAANGLSWDKTVIKVTVDAAFVNMPVSIINGDDTVKVPIGNPVINVNIMEDQNLSPNASYWYYNVTLDGWTVDRNCKKNTTYTTTTKLVNGKNVTKTSPTTVNPKNCMTVQWLTQPMSGGFKVANPMKNNTDYRFADDPIVLQIAKDFMTLEQPATMKFSIIYVSYDENRKLDKTDTIDANINLNVTNTFDPFRLTTSGFLNTTVKHSELYRNDTASIQLTQFAYLGNAPAGVGEIGIDNPDSGFGIQPIVSVKVLQGPPVGYLLFSGSLPTGQINGTLKENQTITTNAGNDTIPTILTWNYNNTYEKVLKASDFPLRYVLNVSLAITKSQKLTVGNWQKVIIQMDLKCINKKFANNWGGTYDDENGVKHMDLCLPCIANGRCFADPKDMPVGADGTYPFFYANQSFAFVTCTPVDGCNGTPQCNDGYRNLNLFRRRNVQQMCHQICFWKPCLL
eukprot:NODE_338_length_9271_cov_0.444178.p1 type:complete len:1301 gc:universal NODE_338_length_9271_cov_0.444178:380-4282(+)